VSSWQLTTPVATLSTNQQGRDFVVGDVHGNLPLLEKALHDVHFDPHKDRLLSVGDLVDRGGHSAAILTWLEKPWFYACIGNHEAVLLDYLSGRSMELASTWTRFGGSWFFALTPAQQSSLGQLILQHCVFALQVSVLQPDGTDSTVGVVHADIPRGISWPQFITHIDTRADWQQACLWSRERAQGQRDDHIEGVDLVVSGHQIVDKAYKRGNVWLIDTAAYRQPHGEGAITLLELGAEHPHRVS
jgi:serine/threonine protein phosphatase 1